MSSFPGETPRPLPANGVRSGMSSRGYRNWQDQGKSRGCLARLRSPCIPGARARGHVVSGMPHVEDRSSLHPRGARALFSGGLRSAAGTYRLQTCTFGARVQTPHSAGCSDEQSQLDHRHRQEGKAVSAPASPTKPGWGRGRAGVCI